MEAGHQDWLQHSTCFFEREQLKFQCGIGYVGDPEEQSKLCPGKDHFSPDPRPPTAVTSILSSLLCHSCDALSECIPPTRA
eukprot:751825-Hanusia_phi.AAC.2